MTQTSAGTFLLDAIYGWTDGNQTPVKAELIQQTAERTLFVTTQPGSKLVATQQPDGTFVGTFTSRNGQPKGLKLEKLSEDELLNVKIRFSAPVVIVKPATDVPASCAAFSGNQGGYAFVWYAFMRPQWNMLVRGTR